VPATPINLLNGATPGTVSRGNVGSKALAYLEHLKKASSSGAIVNGGTADGSGGSGGSVSGGSVSGLASGFNSQSNSNSNSRVGSARVPPPIINLSGRDNPCILASPSLAWQGAAIRLLMNRVAGISSIEEANYVTIDDYHDYGSLVLKAHLVHDYM
jgi:hypothetical protein